MIIQKGKIIIIKKIGILPIEETMIKKSIKIIWSCMKKATKGINQNSRNSPKRSYGK